MSDLLPCPFCRDPMCIGSTTFSHRFRDMGCPIEEQAWQLDAKRIVAWNTRATPPALTAAQIERAAEGIVLTIPRRFVEELDQWATDQAADWPGDTAYQDDLRMFHATIRAALDPAP